MALRARYGPGNRAWSYQRPADDSTNGPPLLPSAFGLALSAEEHTPVPEGRGEQAAPVTTAADAVRAASGAAKSRTRSDAGASATAAARAARAAKTSAARIARASTGSTPAVAATADADAAPRRRSGRVPATTTKARAASPTHTTVPQRTAKRKRSALVPEVPAEAGVETEPAPGSLPSGVPPPLDGEDVTAEQGANPPRATRGGGSKRPRVSQKGEARFMATPTIFFLAFMHYVSQPLGLLSPTLCIFLGLFLSRFLFFFSHSFFSTPTHLFLKFLDLDVKPPRPDEADESKRTTFGSTTTAPDPFTALSAADWTPTQEQNAQPQPERMFFVCCL
jgi:hypothetical protein